MRYKSLAALESAFRQTGNAGEYNLRKIEVPVPGEPLKLNGFLCTPRNRSGYYYASEYPKHRIVIHYTAGQIRSDMSALTRNDYHVSVPFVIARDGTIYQLYSSRYWSGHLGKGLGNTNTGNAEDKCTIGIELSNYGFLKEVAGNLETYYSRRKDTSGNTAPVDVYCSLEETEAYQQLQTPFRGEKYYATFTEAQYESLIVLLRYLTKQYNIPRSFMPVPQRLQTTEDVLRFRGIVTHINYRVDGKWDIGPAFNWQKVIDGVQSTVYQRSATRAATEISIESADEMHNTIHSELEAEPFFPKPKDPVREDQPYEDAEITGDRQADQTKRKLYALLVGIDEYAATIVLPGGIIFPALSGCVKDANKMKTYLNLDPAFDADIKLLANKQATKDNIVKAFKEHLSKAGKDDVVLFYYSGHGTQERADIDVWTSDTDGKLECIACYYDNSKDDFLLADKELRYLIHEIASSQPHIVTIFDCCHSADSTRNGALATTLFPAVVEKRIPFVFPQRDWSKFIFNKKITRDQVIQKGEAVAIPEALHIQLAACESDESAVEEGGEGVFTRTLLKVLQAAGGGVTYQALQNRVRQYLRNVYEQKPRIYVANGDQSLLYSIFLGKPVQHSKNVFGEITYNVKSGWQLNLGAIHGIGNKSGEILVMNPDKIQESYKAQVSRVNTDTTELLIAAQLDKARVYHGYVEGLMSSTLQVNVQNSDGLPADQQALIEQLMQTSRDMVVMEDEEDKAQYVVRCSNGKYFITYPKDPFRPLTTPVNIGIAAAPVLIAGYLQHVSRWEFLNNLKNEDSKSLLSKDALSIELSLSDTEGSYIPVNIKNEEANIDFQFQHGKWGRNMRIKVTNTTSSNLYCSALYLTSYFGSFTGLLNPAVYLLEGGNSVELKIGDNNDIPVKVGEVTKYYNWKEQIECLKFIVSTEEFDANALSLEELPRPVIPSDIKRGDIKGIDLSEKSPADSWGWTTKSIKFRFQNPEHDSIREADLNNMLSNPDTADFALGLYFDAAVSEQLQPVYTLKPGITIIADDTHAGQKGFIQDRVLDLANYWARNRRNNQYREVIRRFPQRLRIVSEGDSWFQHPLVLDVIDHLARVYAIYCVAAAGDTLRNYLSKEKKNGEYFLDAIEEKKPAFFLISGGGNDILGSQFRGYLKDHPDNSLPEGRDPERFLKDSIFEDLKALMDIYRSLFGNLKTHHPEVHVIVHGYDYPVKLDQVNKGWLGRYMIEKGISRRGDRVALIHLIMDIFNDSLKSLAAEFDNVSYIDVRNLIRYDPDNNVDEWYDEIHPDNNGFQQVAMKFMQKIDEVYRRVSVMVVRDGDMGPGSLTDRNAVREQLTEKETPVNEKAKDSNVT